MKIKMLDKREVDYPISEVIRYFFNTTVCSCNILPMQSGTDKKDQRRRNGVAQRPQYQR